MKVLIAPSSFGECGPEPISLLEQHGVEFRSNPYGRKLTAEEVVTLAADSEGILAGVEPLTGDVLPRLKKLRCISRVGVGMQNVDLEVARQLGIEIRNTPYGPTRAVAELTIGLAFALLRQIPMADRRLREGEWRKEMGYLLLGKTVGIVGLGRIGRAAAELFLGLGCRVIASEPKPDPAWLEANPVEILPLHDLLRRSEIISLHLDHLPGAGPLIGRDEIARTRSGAFLLNLARGEALDERALYDSLIEGHLAGAALDVFSEEPYRGPLRDLDQVVLTPHLGSYAREARLEMEIQAVRNLLEVLAVGEDL